MTGTAVPRAGQPGPQPGPTAGVGNERAATLADRRDRADTAQSPVEPARVQVSEDDSDSECVFHSYLSRVSYSRHFCQGPRRQNGQDPQYKVERKPEEEGSITNLLSMLTATPEVDLGMECVLFNSSNC